MGFGRRFRRAVRRVTRGVRRAVREVSRGVSRVGREVGHGVERVGRAGLDLGERVYKPIFKIPGQVAEGVGGMVSSALGALTGSQITQSYSQSEDLSLLKKKSDAEAELEKDRALSQTNLRKKYGSAYGSGYTSRWGKIIK